MNQFLLRRLLLVAMLFSGLCCVVPAQAESNLTITPHLLHFDYREFDDGGGQLLKETGFIPGVDVNFGVDLTNRIQLDVNYQFSIGEIDYDGQTQAGDPHKTDTQMSLKTLGAELSYSLQDAESSVRLFGRLDAKIWDRDIQSTATVQGISEIYSWRQFGVGVLVPLQMTAFAQSNIQFQVFRTINPVMEADLRFIAGGTPEFDLDEKTGWQIETEMFNAYQNKRSLGFSFIYRTWKFGRSDNQTVNTSVGTGEFFEPDSETSIYLLQFVMRMKL